MSKIDASLFSASEHALEQAYGRCPKCDAHLHVRRSKAGPFFGCSAYPNCDFSKPLHEHGDSMLKVMQDSACPLCEQPLAVKKGRFGMFIGCTGFPECHYIQTQQAKPAVGIECPQCQQGELLERKSRYGKTFYACNRYPQCKYLLNEPPVAQACPACDWPLMVRHSQGDKSRLQCPQRQCRHQVDVTLD